MKLKLLLVPAIFLNLFLILPASAKTTWLKCGNYEIKLDDEKERYYLQLSKLHQGSAVFNPQQIDFQVEVFKGAYQDGIRYEFKIDRKSLQYTKDVVSRLHLPGFSDTGWKSEPAKAESGKCVIMKQPPTSGNQI